MTSIPFKLLLLDCDNKLDTPEISDTEDDPVSIKGE